MAFKIELNFIIVVIINPNPCFEPAIIVFGGYLLTSRYVQLSQTVATYYGPPGRILRGFVNN
jgi:hypothetical protein